MSISLTCDCSLLLVDDKFLQMYGIKGAMPSEVEKFLRMREQRAHAKKQKEFRMAEHYKRIQVNPTLPA